jgi:hypothetical protein
VERKHCKANKKTMDTNVLSLIFNHQNRPVLRHSIGLIAVRKHLLGITIERGVLYQIIISYKNSAKAYERLQGGILVEAYSGSSRLSVGGIKKRKIGT